jgi:hypothetical protein
MPEDLDLLEAKARLLRDTPVELSELKRNVAYQLGAMERHLRVLQKNLEDAIDIAQSLLLLWDLNSTHEDEGSG